MSGGVKDWYRQRVAAVTLIPLCLWLLYAGGQLAGAEHAAASDFFARPMNGLAAILLGVIGLYHTQAGAEGIIQDYAPGEGLQKFLILVSKIGCTAGALVVIWAVAKSFIGA